PRVCRARRLPGTGAARDPGRSERGLARTIVIRHLAFGIWHLMRYAVRTLLKTPGFTAIAITTIALGIAANTAIFSVVNAVLLRPLPFRDESRVVMVYTSTADAPKSNHSAADFLDLERGNRTFEALAGFREDVASVATKPGEPKQIQAVWVTAPFFDVL